MGDDGLEAGGCGVCISSDCDNPAEFSSTKILRARKEHRCCECRAAIPRGDRYERTAGKWDGDLYVFKTCLACVDVRTSLCCDGWSYTSLWEDAAEALFRHLTTGCLAKLKTAAGKEKLLEQWRKWKGLVA